MPEMDGLTAIEKIRDCEKKAGAARTPIVALSAGALEEDLNRSLKAGADLHVSKPVKKTLIDAIVELHRISYVYCGVPPLLSAVLIRVRHAKETEE